MPDFDRNFWDFWAMYLRPARTILSTGFHGTGIGGSVGTFFEKSKRVPQTTTFFALKLPLKKYAGWLFILGRIQKGTSRK